MKNISSAFIRVALIFALVGMGLGLYMAMSGDHSQRPAHAHINLLGWVTMMLYGLFYKCFDDAGRSRLARIQFWITTTGVAVMNAGIFALYGGLPQAEPAAAVGSLLVIAGLILFALIATRTTAGDPA